MFAVSALTYLITTPIIGYLVDRSSTTFRRAVFLVASCVLGFNFFLIGPASFFHLDFQITPVIFGMIILGIFGASSFVPPFAEVLFQIGETHAHIASGVVTGAEALGAYELCIAPEFHTP